jgi:hypothetical protein
VAGGKTTQTSAPHYSLGRSYIACVIIPQGAQVVKNVLRKATSAVAVIDEQIIEVGPQTFRVPPHGRDEIGDARVEIAKRVRLDPTRYGIEPFLCAWQKECNGSRSTLPREVRRNFRRGWLIPVGSIGGLSYCIDQPGVLAVDRAHFGCVRRYC